MGILLVDLIVDVGRGKNAIRRRDPKGIREDGC
jgi:hypothetical protein